MIISLKGAFFICAFYVSIHFFLNLEGPSSLVLRTETAQPTNPVPVNIYHCTSSLHRPRINGRSKGQNSPVLHGTWRCYVDCLRSHFHSTVKHFSHSPVVLSITYQYVKATFSQVSLDCK